MRRLVLLASVVTVAVVPLAAFAQTRGRPVTAPASPDGRAPWQQPWQYDSGGGNDKRPALPYYQQGGGQQTGGPARNLLPYDGFTLVPQ